jgi:hypothetical protein
MINFSDSKNLIISEDEMAAQGGTAKVYPGYGTTMFVVAALPSATKPSDVFQPIDNFSKWNLQKGKDPVDKKAALFAVVLKADAPGERWPADWHTKVLPLVLPRTAGQTLSEMMADADMGYQVAYFAEDGSVRTQDDDGNALAPTVFKMSKFKENGFTKYTFAALPPTSPVVKGMGTSFTLPEVTLDELVEAEAASVRLQVQRSAAMGAAMENTGAPSAPKAPAPSTAPTASADASNDGELTPEQLATASALGLTVEQFKAVLNAQG